ncbi:MAG: hypothetical protein PF637_11790 [Spirochaetes bacterium]|jgi:UDP-2,4-diacetamido-2,4,6-trideoxy-beta-L-altropyranose hydrolase|nr:hypothetical protein [Spirochaetota bacterium]
MAEIMLSLDLAIMAAGTTIFEAAICGFPVLLVSLANNQISQGEAWAGLGACVYAGYLPEFVDNDFKNIIQQFFNDFDSWQKIRYNALSLVDGRGANRLATSLLDLVEERKING